jgi:HK97 family phage major capsid protein/HK97 family phage prohead protease
LIVADTTDDLDNGAGAASPKPTSPATGPDAAALPLPDEGTRDIELPRDGLIRAISGCEVRDAPVGDASPGTMHGYLAVFNEWSEINSIHEGHFMERMDPGAFARTIQNNGSKMKVTFNHGKDPSLGDKVLGIPTMLEADSRGVRYEVPLFDTQYNRELAPGLRAGAYGSSFRFKVLRDNVNRRPMRSSHNPEGLPERTVTEVGMKEFGPVTYPQYPDAMAGMRSMTDEFMVGRLLEQPGTLKRLVDFNVDGDLTPPPARGNPAPGAGPSKTAAPRRQALKPAPKPETQRSEKTHMNRDERTARITELETWLRDTNETYAEDAMPDEVKLDWERNDTELNTLRVAAKEIEQRAARVAALDVDRHQEPGTSYPTRTFEPRNQINRMSHDEVHNLDTISRTNAFSPEQASREFKDRALRSVEMASFPHPDADKARSQAHLEDLLKNKDAPDERHYGQPEIARRILVTGSSQYRSAINKYIAGSYMTNEEERAMSLGTTTAGGFAVVYELDPSFIRTSNLSVNPFRAIARVVTIAGTNEWRGVTSGGVTAAYGLEASESTDNSPTLAQPAVIVQKASAFVPVSIEATQDINGLQGELSEAFQDAKDDLEATEFTTGVGTTVHPQGILVGATTTQAAGGSGTVALADLFLLEQALPPRFKSRASLVANRFVYNKIRAFDTSGGAALWLGYPNPLQGGAYANGGPTDGRLNQPLMGYTAYEDSAMAAALTTGSLIMVMGDFSKFVIVDRLGMDIEVIPHLFGGSNRFPTGQRGIYAYWRNSSKVLTANAFRVLVTS